MKHQLVTRNFGGNLHATAHSINRMGLSDFVLAMDSNTSGTIVVFKVPASMAPDLRKYFGTLPEYQANPQPERKWP